MLARSLLEDNEDDVDAKELLLAAKELEQVEQLIPANATELSPEIKNEIKKKGWLNRLKDIWEDLNNEDSDLYKKLSKVKRGIETVEKIASNISVLLQKADLI